MPKFGALEIPPGILDAQENGSLVIFAGAGISRDAPTGLPGFKDLAMQIGLGSNIPFHADTNEPLDIYLGRLQSKGIKVHELAAEILTSGNPEPNEYHKLIPKIFSQTSSIRIVTTNQDLMLTSSLKVLGNKIDEYIGPALPLGDNFSGLVYLHGTVYKFNEMVLTDIDFGHAYLSRGWARRFLLHLFNKYTVLFIGYGHEDTVLKYLARGLPTEGAKRFAFICGKDEKAKWEHLGISTIIYQNRNKDGSPHNELISGLKIWVDETSMELSKHGSQIKLFALSPPPVLGPDHEYLKRKLKDSALIKIFIENANDSKWVKWADKEAYFEPFLRSDEIDIGDKREAVTLWANWLAEKGIAEGNNEALRIVRRPDVQWNSILWHAVALSLHIHRDIPHERFINWTRALLAAPTPARISGHELGYILMECKPVERRSIALALFEKLTHPAPKLSEDRFLASEDDSRDSRWELSFLEDEYWVRKAWKVIFRPNLGRFVEDLLPMVEANLRLAYELIQSGPEDFDSFNFRRYHISPPASSAKGHIWFNHVLDVLIDAVRDCLVWTLNENPEEGLSIARKYLRTPKALFPRIALYAMDGYNQISSETKIQMILDSGINFYKYKSPELSSLLQDNYAGFSLQNRIALLEMVENQRPEKDPDSGEDWGKWVHLKYLRMLHDAAPDCEETSKRWDDARKGIPENELPTQIPGEMKAPSAEWTRAISPFKTDQELIESDPDKILDIHAKLNSEDILNREADQSGLESQIYNLAKTNLSFGIQLAKALNNRKAFNHRIWRDLFNGWSQSNFEKSDWNQIIETLGKNIDAVLHYPNQTAEILLVIVRDKNKWPDYETLSKIEALSQMLLNKSEEDEPKEIGVQDWYLKAINSTCGKITQFWLFALEWHKKVAGGEWKGLPEDYIKRFERIVDGDKSGCMMGQVILVSHMSFIAFLDESWTRDKLAPILDLNNNKARALRSWSGFAFLGRMSGTFVTMIRPYFAQLFDHMNELEGTAHEGIVDRISGIVQFEGAEWSKQGLLTKFVSSASEDDLVQFTRNLGHFFSAMVEPELLKDWNAWIREYIHQRRSGKPKDFYERELGELAAWVFPFKSVINDFVNIVSGLPAPNMLHSHLLHELEESDLPSKEPEAMTDFLIWALKGVKRGEFWSGKELLNILSNLEKHGVSTTKLDTIRSECVRLGVRLPS